MSNSSDEVASEANDERSEEELDSAAVPASSRLLIFAASLLAIVSTLNVWVERQLLDTDEWVDVSDQLLADEQVRNLLAVYLVDELYAAVDLDAELQNRLPENLDPLAGLISGALRGPATDAVDRLLATETVRSAWSSTNRASHATLVAILRDDTPAGVSTADGAVTFELGELVVIVGQELGISDEALARIPDDAGSITVVESDELAAAQSFVRLIEVLSVVLFVVVVALYAAAIYVAPGRRADVLRWVGLSLVFVGGVLLVARRISTRAAADALTGTEETSEVAGLAMRIGTEILREMAIAGIAIGLLLLCFGWLLGASSSATGARSAMGPLFLRGPVGVWLTATAALLVVLYLLPGEPIRSWWRGLAFLVVFAIAFEALRRQIRDEHAEISTAGHGVDEAEDTTPASA